MELTAKVKIDVDDEYPDEICGRSCEYMIPRDEEMIVCHLLGEASEVLLELVDGAEDSCYRCEACKEATQ